MSSPEPNSKKPRTMAEEEQPSLSAEQLDRFSRQNAALGKKGLGFVIFHASP